ncbi:ABC transporter permease [Desulfovibrio sulfodismutans]|uniref:ABC transporter permease n=1 Tax=Desulfolutivibrio sulfodismutans TaxID=63561 RepID=A0A7K3NPN6_9BACT|nr:ABC transporter permease [Desulfolutivibrio sulfodismutans]NDY57793.1 ABC transporter permease [Desulfolutivibrio sulfodismutans]QLA13624.1 ABC transporter permease subunit [Desulfolutivibrio sulfodismutans DSM 3696]
MTGYLLRRIVHLAALLAAVSVLSFTLVSMSPIDPVDAYIGADVMKVGPEQRAKIAARWGLDKPPLERFTAWAGNLVRGDFGVSAIYSEPVLTVIGKRFAMSLWLMALAWVFSGLFGFVLGVVAGAFEGGLFDRAVRFYAYLLAGTPTFWLGLLLLLVFSVALRLTPVCCAFPPGVTPEEATVWQRLWHLALPAATLSIVGVSAVILHTRQKMIQAMRSDYALFARAQGEDTMGVVRHHALRNVVLPAVTLQFATLGELFGGSILAEQVFSYPGLGQATVEAGLRGDVPLLLGIVLVSAVFVFTGNTVADLLYRAIDPRIGWRGAA